MESEIAIEIRGKMKSDSLKQAVHINGDFDSDFAATQALDIINQDSETKSAFQALGINGGFETDFVTQVFDINVDLEDSETVSLAEEGLNRSRSSSSSSSSSFTGSSSEECFQLGRNKTDDDASLGSPSDDDDNNAPTTPLTSSEPNRETPPTLALRNSGSTSTTTPPPRIGQDEENVAFASASETDPPKVTFQVARAERHKGGDFLSLKTAMPSHLSSVVPLPTHQAMERPNEASSSSSYRIPSCVFARASAAAEWSAASNESLFSIHMGNVSFNGDQYFFCQGKSDELGLSSPAARCCGAVPDEDYCRAAEARAAETMREVIRETAENRAKEEASSIVSRQSEDCVKSFAFPVLLGDGNKSVSVKGRAWKKEDEPQTATLEDTTKTNQIVVHNRWNSYSCFTCCRLSCY